MRGAPPAVGDNLLVRVDVVSFHHDLIFELRWDGLEAPVVEFARVAEDVLAVVRQAGDPVIQMLVQLCDLCRARCLPRLALRITGPDD